VLDSHCAAVSSGYIALSSELTRAMNWSAVSPAGGGFIAVPAAGACSPGEGVFLQADNDNRLAVTASASKAWRWVTGVFLKGRGAKRWDGQG